MKNFVKKATKTMLTNAFINIYLLSVLTATGAYGYYLTNKNQTLMSLNDLVKIAIIFAIPLYLMHLAMILFKGSKLLPLQLLKMISLDSYLAVMVIGYFYYLSSIKYGAQVYIVQLALPTILLLAKITLKIIEFVKEIKEELA